MKLLKLLKSINLNIKKDEYDFFELAYQALQNDINSPWQVGNILTKLISYLKLNKYGFLMKI